MKSGFGRVLANASTISGMPPVYMKYRSQVMTLSCITLISGKSLGSSISAKAYCLHAYRNSTKDIGYSLSLLTLPTGNESPRCMAMPSADPVAKTSYSGAASLNIFSEVIALGTSCTSSKMTSVSSGVILVPDSIDSAGISRSTLRSASNNIRMLALSKNATQQQYVRYLTIFDGVVYSYLSGT